MTDWDVTPRVARRLRNLGDSVAPDELDPEETDEVPDPHHEPGPATTTPPPASMHTSIWDRRKEPKADPDAIDIGLETNHAWWAQRENLELLVNPKKRGAAARARRAAEAAFAPPGAQSPRSGATRAAHTGTGGATHHSAWDPSQVYSWSTPTADEPAADDRTRHASEPPVDDPGTRTPWDILGLTSDATWVEVTRRHKQLAKQHHPDRHTGVDEEARRTAEVTMSEINAAFADLRRIYQLTSGI